MGLITLGSLTFSRNPQDMTPLDPVRYNAHVLTYSNVAHFSWGADIVGKEIDMTWPIMPADEFDNLQTIYEADNTVVLTPNDGSALTFSVELTNLNSRYYPFGRTTSATDRRQDVVLTLLIIAQN